LYCDEAQGHIARLGYRPYKPYAAHKAGVDFYPLTLAPITDIARDWDDANDKFFAENGVIDLIIGSRRQ
jgi:sulfate transport system substrate-binding protein